MSRSLIPMRVDLRLSSVVPNAGQICLFLTKKLSLIGDLLLLSL